MGAGIVGVSVKRKLPDIVLNPEIILTIAVGSRVLFKGVECVVEGCPDSEEIWFTTVDSRVAEYNALMEEFLNGDYFADGMHPNYRSFVKHIRVPHHVVNDEPGKSTKRNRWGIGFHTHTRAVNKRALFRNVIDQCEIK
jgi:hypothetical protein